MMNNKKEIKGISVLNPVRVDREIYLRSIDHAIKHGYNHIQLIGPIHDPVRGNVDGMVFYKKYSRFNSSKDADYVNHCIKVVNEALEKSHAAGIETYMWHHELDIPDGFCESFPELLNEYGDVEVSHPILKDFLENKLKDFFETYPLMDGLVITYYETKVPLMRLKNQKLSTTERMKYVTQLLYDTCAKYGKKIIVRTDATLEEDYVTLLKVYEQVSTDMVIMDKWTQFDWSLTLPPNQFIRNVDKNPQLMETDLFGEYFGKGRFPLMLRKHIEQNYAHCEKYYPCGYVSRIDRSGFYPWDEVNEVNLVIMHALMSGENVDEAIDLFFKGKYGKTADKVRAVMERTEDVVRKILFLNGYYFSELSRFPTLNHSKNHFYFEMMRENYCIASDEWFVPAMWDRGNIGDVFEEIELAKEEAAVLLQRVLALKDDIIEDEYTDLYVKFKNLDLCARIWGQLVEVFFSYSRYIDGGEREYYSKLKKGLSRLLELEALGKEQLGDMFHCVIGDRLDGLVHNRDMISEFVRETEASLAYEERKSRALAKEGLTDYVICGGACEGHKLQKEVNFSDTLMRDGELCRIPGNRKGLEWSTINAHGWFSYEMNITPESDNLITVEAGSNTDTLCMKVTIGDSEHTVNAKCDGKAIVSFNYRSKPDEKRVRIRFEKISANVPCIYTVEVK